jgi:acyl-CoA synthetase (AMP-forming)/AMP-acid ligase II
MPADGDDAWALDARVAAHAAASPRAPAVACEAFRWTYAELDGAVDAAAAVLRGAGLQPGDIVAVLGHSRPECLVAFLAASRLGAVYLGLNPKYTVRELAFVLGDAQPALVIGLHPESDAKLEARLAAALRELPAPLRVLRRHELLAPRTGPPVARPAAWSPDDAVAIVYTSGSTGAPKGALLSSRGIVRSAELTHAHWFGGAGDLRTVAQHPINHVGWLVCECAAVLVGGGLLYFRERFDGAATLRLIERERLNLWLAFPSMIGLAMQSDAWAGADLSSLRRVAFGSLPTLDLVRRLRERTDAVFCVSYGLTEASGGAVTATRDDAALEVVATSIGPSVPGVEIRVVDADGADVPDGAPGELLVKDVSVFMGYLNRPEATATALAPDGWLHTGDVVTRDPDGGLRLVGRLREMFKSGGYNVYPTEVEAVIAEHAAVRTAAVVEAPDPLWSEVGVAYVVLAPGARADAEALRAHARDRLANYKVPKRFVIVDALPQLPNGKPDKLRLRELARTEASHSIA